VDKESFHLGVKSRMPGTSKSPHQSVKDFLYSRRLSFVLEMGLNSNPSSVKKMQRFMCADLSRSEKGRKTQTGMSKKQLRDFCHKGTKKQ